MAYPELQTALLEHVGPWTAEDYLALPEGLRVELLDGELVMSPNASYAHQDIAARLCEILRAAQTPEWRTFFAVNLRLDEWRFFIPDLVVIRPRPGPIDDRVFGEAADAALVVEVVSPGSRATDRAIKPRLYAEAGIPGYLRVEQSDGPPILTAYLLRDGVYEPAPLADVVPFPVEIDPAELVD